MSHLFESLKMGQLTLENRVIIAPMCQYSADEGAATDWHTLHYLVQDCSFLKPRRSIRLGVLPMPIWDYGTTEQNRASNR